MLDLMFEPFRTFQSYRGGGAFDGGRTFQRRWAKLAIESLHQYRESIDASYRLAIQLVEQTLRSSEARSPEDVRRATEEVWRKLVDLLEQQSESQMRDFQAWAAKLIEIQRSSA